MNLGKALLRALGFVVILGFGSLAVLYIFTWVFDILEKLPWWLGLPIMILVIVAFITLGLYTGFFTI